MQEKYNFLYVWSSSDEFELKNSVRVLRKNYPNSKVCLVGDKPKTLEVDFYIPHKQEGTNKFSRITSSILHACNYLDNFVLLWDDLFLNKNIDFIIAPNRGNLVISGDSTYQNALKNTVQLLKFFDLTTFNFECHNPFYVESRKALGLFDKINWQNQNHVFKSLYGNFYQVKTKLSANAKTKDHEYFLKLYNEIGYCSLSSDVTNEMRQTVLEL